MPPAPGLNIVRQGKRGQTSRRTAPLSSVGTSPASYPSPQRKRGHVLATATAESRAESVGAPAEGQCSHESGEAPTSAVAVVAGAVASAIVENDSGRTTDAETTVAVRRAILTALEGRSVADLRAVQTWATVSKTRSAEGGGSKRRRVESDGESAVVVDPATTSPPHQLRTPTEGHATQGGLRMLLDLVLQATAAALHGAVAAASRVLHAVPLNAAVAADVLSPNQAAAARVSAACGGAIDAISLDTVAAIVPADIRAAVLHILDPTAASGRAALVAMAPPTFAIAGLILQGALDSNVETLDLELCHRFICTASRSTVPAGGWWSTLVEDLCCATLHAIPPSPPTRTGCQLADAALRWPLTLPAARRALGRTYVLTGRHRDCLLTSTAVSRLVTGPDSVGTRPGGVFAICLEQASAAVASTAVDWLWVAVAAVAEDHAAVLRVWGCVCLTDAADATIATAAARELAVALLGRCLQEEDDPPSRAASEALLTIMCTPAFLSVVEHADAAQRPTLERASAAAMLVMAHRVQSTAGAGAAAVPSHPRRSSAAQAAGLLAAVIGIRVQLGGAVAPAVRWAAKLIGGGDGKTALGKLFEACPPDALVPLVGIAKRIITSERVDAKAKKSTFKLLGWLTETRGSLAAILSERMGPICVVPIEMNGSTNAAVSAVCPTWVRSFGSLVPRVRGRREGGR
jgi:hypothetical protein